MISAQQQRPLSVQHPNPILLTNALSQKPKETLGELGYLYDTQGDASNERWCPMAINQYGRQTTNERTQHSWIFGGHVEHFNRTSI